MNAKIKIFLKATVFAGAVMLGGCHEDKKDTSTTADDNGTVIENNITINENSSSVTYTGDEAVNENDAVAEPQGPDEGMPLTAGEIALAEKIFGNEMNYTVIGKDYGTYEGYEDVAAVTTGNFMVFNVCNCEAQDLSDEKNRGWPANFMHEMMHVYQYQTGNVYHSGHVDTQENHDPYYFRLSAQKIMEEFTDEQQAAIVEQYYEYFLTKNKVSRGYMLNEDSDRYELLRKTVEDFFPTASVSRQAYEAASDYKPRAAVAALLKPKPLQIVDVDKNNYAAEVDSAKETVLIDFWASWCAPCRWQGGVLKEFAAAGGANVKIVKINDDQNDSLSQVFKVKALPTLIVIRGGKEVRRHEGALDKGELKAFIR